MRQENHIEVLSTYIDDVNKSKKHTHEAEPDEKLKGIYKTVHVLKEHAEIELPSQDYVERVAKQLKQLQERKESNLQKKKKSSWIFSKAFPIAASILLISSLLWQQIGTPASASQITVVKETSLTSLGESEVLHPAYIQGENAIVFEKEEQIWELDLDTNEKKAFPLGEFQYMRDPSWSPDGKSIAFVGYKDGIASIWTMDRGGQGMKQVTFPANNTEFHENPTWSPDGKTIAYTKTIAATSEPHGVAVDSQEIWTIDVTRNNTKKIIDGINPQFSPDGNMLSFTREAGDGQFEIWTSTVDGKNPKKRTEGQESTWSPDGQFLVYSKITEQTEVIEGQPNQTFRTSLRQIWAVHLETGKLSQLTDVGVSEQEKKELLQSVGDQNSGVPLEFFLSGENSDYAPMWSNDRTKLFFIRTNNDESKKHFNLYELTLEYE
ncbi:TolB family protein [Fredinandcohnia humi]